MKILAIRGENLASLEDEFEVDFTKEPLSSTGLFAVTGPTGSGKSTLLDAMCLALFDDAPRLHKADKNAKIKLVETEVTAKDSRNLFRRGAKSGYAEVDFVGIDGNKYRSRWSVASTKNLKSIKKPILKVVQLDNNVELTGTISSIKSQIIEKLGLSYDQFVRSVLLAQGDFACFLNAGEKEKSEILEKITGTEIYTQMAETICEKYKDAAGNLDVVENEIKANDLLSDEQINELREKVKEDKSKIEDIEKSIATKSKKVEWILKFEQFTKLFDDAKAQYDAALKLDADAQPRKDMLKIIDAVAGIRDTYLRYVDNQKREQNETEALSQAREKSKSLEIVIKSLNENQKKCIDNRNNAQKRISDSTKLFSDVRKLDSDIVTNQSLLNNSSDEIEKHKAKIDGIKKRIGDLGKNIDKEHHLIEEADKWINDNFHYKEVIETINVVVDRIKKSYELTNNISENEKNTQKLESELANFHGLLEGKKKAQEILNLKLPEEVMALRKALTNNTACPVCGSLNHPWAGTLAETEEWKILKKEKEDIKKEIDNLSSDIQNIIQDIAICKASKANSNKEKVSLFNEIANSLSGIHDWSKMYEDETLCGHLQTVAHKWNLNNSAKEKYAKCIEKLNSSLIKDKQSFDEENRDLLAKETKHKSLLYTCKRLQEDRVNLFGSLKVDDVEKELRSVAQKCQIALDNVNEEINKYTAENKAVDGRIKVLTNNIAENSKAINGDDKKINDWLSSNGVVSSRQDLQEKVAIDSIWIANERNELKEIADNLLKVKTKKEEREKMLSEHLKSDDKANDEESAESLQNELNELSKLKQTYVGEAANINANLDFNDRIKKSVEAKQIKFNELEKEKNDWFVLYDLFGKAGKFRTIAQGYTMDVLLCYANEHLRQFYDRYELARISADSLSLHIIDHNMFDEERSINSLSGGETFLVSLALALGLSSFSSNNIHVESLFIDEGFGSLDVETLNIALDVLERLQTQGRKIGIISHVTEMTERIQVKINMRRESNTKSVIEIA